MRLGRCGRQLHWGNIWRDAVGAAAVRAVDEGNETVPTVFVGGRPHVNPDAGDFPGAALWRKSSYSNGDGGNCLEVAENIPGPVPVRDSKTPDGPALILTATARAPFIASLKG